MPLGNVRVGNVGGTVLGLLLAAEHMKLEEARLWREGSRSGGRGGGPDEPASQTQEVPWIRGHPLY
jgi:hypothetical protein